MRILAVCLFLLALVVGGLAIFLYLLGQGASCAYSLDGGECRFRFPWEMGREDLIYLFILPWSIVAALVVGGVSAWRKVR